MRTVLLAAALVVAFALSGCVNGFPFGTPPTAASVDAHETDNVVVIAVVDSGFNPYHWDFAAALMPQHQDDDPSNDLPLDRDPASWLPGHPGPGAFASYAPIHITLDLEDPDALVTQTTTSTLGIPNDPTTQTSEPGLYEMDQDEWQKVQQSSRDEVHYHWFPGTKAVGFVNFGGGTGFGASSHGVGVASVSVGNLHGACPECLLVFVNGPSEAANEWVAQQDWIDLQTNSWGLSLVMRDRLYAGSDTELQRTAVERGHSIFFSAGNGQANTFTVPNPTLWSSQEGPDWIITVGAIHPEDGSSYTGHGKPSDIAHVGSQYPSAGGNTVNGTGTFGGTSNATPVTAGTFARALYLLRQEMAGPSRVQEGGVIAQGAAACGAANPDCALADGQLTVHELRTSLYRASEYVAPGIVVGASNTRAGHPNEETRYISEGHGSFWGRLRADGQWWRDSERIAGHANGSWAADAPQPSLVDWMVAVSHCRQSFWGTWDHGYWNAETDLPPSDHVNWPLRTWFTEECPTRGKLIHDAVTLVNGRDGPAPL